MVCPCERERERIHCVAEAETTVYSDRLSIHYRPISDVLGNIQYFFCIIQMILL